MGWTALVLKEKLSFPLSQKIKSILPLFYQFQHKDLKPGVLQEFCNESFSPEKKIRNLLRWPGIDRQAIKMSAEGW